MNVSIFGAGYVGSVSAACLADLGHVVTLVDVNRAKVDYINRGKAPIVEPDLDELVARNVAAGRLRATTCAKTAVAESEVSLICVGTPSTSTGDLDLTYIRRVCEQIGEALGGKLSGPETPPHKVIVRSTMLPGSVRGVVLPTIERSSGLTEGEGFKLAIYPEFLRESTAILDFFDSILSVFGVSDPTDPTAADVLRRLNGSIDSEHVVVSYETAEVVKYVCNAWHAVKITFANEVGNICKAAGLDGHQVMDVMCKDTQLNISPAYLKPGFAFGGSCLPKDLRALRRKARALEVDTPLFDAVMRANDKQILKAFEMIEDTGLRSVSMFGLTFKSGTDDLRESPLVELAERLLGKGYALKIYDSDLNTGMLTGSNLEYVQTKLTHLSELLAHDIDEAIGHGEAIIVGKREKGLSDALKVVEHDKHVIDLVRLAPATVSNGRYSGICW